MQFAKTSGFAALQFGRLSKNNLPAQKSSSAKKRASGKNLQRCFLCKPPFPPSSGFYSAKRRAKKTCVFQFFPSRPKAMFYVLRTQAGGIAKYIEQKAVFFFPLEETSRFFCRIAVCLLSLLCVRTFLPACCITTNCTTQVHGLSSSSAIITTYCTYKAAMACRFSKREVFLPSGFFACLCFFLPLSLFSQKPKCPFILTIAMTDKNAIFICEGAQVCDKLPVASGDPLKALFISAAALMASQGSRLK